MSSTNDTMSGSPVDTGRVLVTGGTGSFGSTMVSRLLETNVDQVRVLSRDEAKQDAMRRTLSDNRVKFFLGDVRDADSVRDAVRGTDFVFHAAALKQVPSCEFFPTQAVRTNVLGSSNVVEAAGAAGVQSVVCLSTDKAVYPINAMGMSKAMMEKVAQAYARNNPDSETIVSVTRYGNVMCSRGSVIPLFIEQVEGGKAPHCDGAVDDTFPHVARGVGCVGGACVRQRTTWRPFRAQGTGMHGGDAGEGGGDALRRR